MKMKKSNEEKEHHLKINNNCFTSEHRTVFVYYASKCMQEK